MSNTPTELLIYSRIRELCAERGISIASVELAAGLKNGALSKWDRSEPGALKLNRVAEVLGVSIMDLIGGRDGTTTD